MAIMCLGSNNCGPSNFQSIILLDNRIDTEYAYFTLDHTDAPDLDIMGIFTELKISKKMKSARTDLPIGNIGSPH